MKEGERARRWRKGLGAVCTIKNKQEAVKSRSGLLKEQRAGKNQQRTNNLFSKVL